MKRQRCKRGAALLMAAVLSAMAVIPYLPDGFFKSWAFGLVFANSGQAGHPYIKGTVAGESEECYFLCLDHGASAHSNYDYSKENKDVDYANGSQWEKELFWAYIMAFGSYDEEYNKSMIQYKNLITKDQARSVAWKQGTPAAVTQKINEFMSLSNIPAGCKSAEDIYSVVGNYGTKETAIGMSSLLSGPNTLSLEKLYNIAGLDSAASFKRYCKINVVQPEGGRWTNPDTGTAFVVQTVQTDTGDFKIGYVMADGTAPAAGETKGAPPIIAEVNYDPNVFSIRKISGQIEYFKCNVPGSQRLVRVKGREEITPVRFYITNGAGSTQGGTGGGGGTTTTTDGDISYKIYEHTETFESNYKVELEKRDYETGNPLKGSVWQCLEAFPDRSRLSGNEEAGGLREENMREEPTSWNDWLVFEENMVTDGNGHISHEDKRYYDFKQYYCNGHPLPPEPEPEEGEEEGEGEGEDLMEEWQAMVDACEEKAASCTPGTFHHWLCGSESEPEEAEAFEKSGCKANRDAAYENFINLRYSYTFRETNARDGYILHGQNGHPDDVPIEIITTAASEADQSAEWSACSNEDIRVSGHINNMIFEDESEGTDEDTLETGIPFMARAARETERLAGLILGGSSDDAAASDPDAELSGEKLYLTEVYDLSLIERLENLLRKFFGLPEKYASEYHYTVNLVASERERTATSSDASETDEDVEMALFNDLDTEADSTGNTDSMGDSDDTAHADKEDTATGSNAALKEAADTGAYENDIRKASDSDAAYRYAPVSAAARLSMNGSDGENAGKVRLAKASGDGDSSVSGIGDSQPPVTPGEADKTLHKWIVHDHRSEGEVHINKRDMELKAGESGLYDSYGDTQGDSTLEGAVYGLFAADDIYHPDTQRAEDGSVVKGSGIVFDANDLVAVATTDKNGDASFMAITEIPHTTYDYSQGKTVTSGKAYPKNLFDMDGYRKADNREEKGRIYQDCATKNGCLWIGRPLLLGNYYVKELSRSEGYELSVTGRDKALTNAEGSERESYGMTADALSHPVGKAWVKQKLEYATTFPEANETYGNKANLMYFETASNNATQGYDVVIDGIPEGADIFYDNVKITPVTVLVPVNGHWADATEEPLYQTADSDGVLKRDIDGSPIVDKDAQPTMPVPYTGYAYPAKTLDTSVTAAVSDTARYGAAYEDTQENKNYVKYEFEQMVRQMGGETPKDGSSYSGPTSPVYDEPASGGYGVPEVTVEVTGVGTNASLIEALLDHLAANRVFTYAGIQDITAEGDTCRVTLAIGMSPGKDALYEKDENGDIQAVYLVKPNDVTGRYVVRKYTGSAAVATQVTAGSSRYSVQLVPDFEINDEGLPVDRMRFENEYDRYLKYNAGDVLYDYWYEGIAGEWIGHAPVARKTYVYDYEEKTVEESNVNASRIPVVASREEVADRVGSTYAVYDRASGQYTLHVGTRDTDLTGVKSASFTIAFDGATRTVTEEDSKKLGNNNAWEIKAGDTLSLAEYLVRVQGAGVGAFACSDFDRNNTFIRNQKLIYNGGYAMSEDGNTAESPLTLEERPIRQKVKVTKKIDEKSYNNTSSYAAVHEDWWTRMFGGFDGAKAADKMPGFRFKTYLRSNLERLYRDESGAVTWQDKNGEEYAGNDAGLLAAKRKFPALVETVYTKALHKTDPLKKDPRDAVTANTALYSYTDGLINAEQNPGYTAVLETVTRKAEDGAGTRLVTAYNYDKFFDALAVANNDKWDNSAPTYTSHQPIGNAPNRTQAALENASASDAVRQFAIDWYLDDEVAKLVRPVNGSRTETENKTGSLAYSDELYDEALQAAIKKAENYLKPFFAYDLDTIYAIEWDGEEDGGADHDKSTLSADALREGSDADESGYCYGVSAYLPYGTYVIVEQQPQYAELEDFKNKHYEIDRPREVELPAVYDSYAGSQGSPEVMNGYYAYRADMAQDEMERKFMIRFGEESHIIYAHGRDGDFEVYKYGMDLDRITNGVPAAPGAGDHFALTQSEYRPDKNYYNESGKRSADGNAYYLTEGQSGRTGISARYRYSSVSEDAGTADDVAYPGGTVTDDNKPGIYYKDNVKTMQGVKRAYDGKYAPMLVPYTVTAPQSAATEGAQSAPSASGEASYVGYGYTKFMDRLYTAKLRIEKLDSETHENILHDGALFSIYAAKRDDSRDGDGKVLFYEEDTTISGTKEFLTAMGAKDIRPMARTRNMFDRLRSFLTGDNAGPGTRYTGLVPAGTPVCAESEQIVLGDPYGKQTVAFRAYSTVRDGMMKNEDGTGEGYELQTVGYLETPQPLSAGAYVLCEMKAPSGYVRTKPIAVEIYSDKVTYYKEGNKDSRILAALYADASDNLTANGTKPQDRVNVARVNVENVPITLKVEKLKESSADTANTTADKTVSYKVSGRVEGNILQIGNNPDLVYAYENGRYLGYAWKKGTLEYLAARKAAGEDVEIVYNGSVFAGYGYVTRSLETADDANRYVAGATMTLFEAIPIEKSGYEGDYRYNGVKIERNSSNRVTRMYIEEGYAGETVEFVKETDEDGNEITTTYQAGVNKDGDPIMAEGNVWNAVTVKRGDTDILYYDLSELDISRELNVEGSIVRYFYDKDHNLIPADEAERDRRNYKRTDTDHSVYAFKDLMPYLEFVGGDFTKIRYLESDNQIEVDEDTLIYHLDGNRNRDALVDPQSGMAYVTEMVDDGSGSGTLTERKLVWPVNVRKNGRGDIYARDKITTYRVATIGENRELSGESGYITGSWRSEAGEESHKEVTMRKDRYGQNMNDEVLMDINNGDFIKDMNPTVDAHGLTGYYQKSGETYDKGTDLYDRDGDFVRQQDSDNLDAYNDAAYRVNATDELHDGDETKEAQERSKLYHRMGEGYILENTWVTSDKTPNDPFDTEATDGQADILKRVPAGHYILEELKSPAGYLKGMPVGISVEEKTDIHEAQMVDYTTKIEISKINGAEDYGVHVRDMDHEDPISGEKPADLGIVTTDSVSYTHKAVEGAELALYPAKAVISMDFKNHPMGYYLVRTSDEPVTWHDTGYTVSDPVMRTGHWITGSRPIYIEGLPEGYYLLEEIKTPDGYATAKPVEITLEYHKEVQSYLMYNDLTKVEIEKFYTNERGDKKQLPGASFLLYAAKTDEDGKIIYDTDGNPEHGITALTEFRSSSLDEWQNFMPAFDTLINEITETDT